MGVAGYLTDQSASNFGIATVTYQEHFGVLHPTGVVTSIGTAYVETDDPRADVRYEATWCCEGMAVRKSNGVLKHDTTKTLKPD